MRVATRSAALVASLTFGLAAATTTPFSHPPSGPCPVDCDGTTGDKWTVYNSTDGLQSCDRQLVLDLPLRSDSKVQVRACAVPQGDLTAVRSGLNARDDSSNVTLCVDEASPIDVSLDVGFSGNGSEFTYVTADTIASVSSYLSQDCNKQTTFMYGQGGVVGVFAGSAIDNGGSVPYVLAEAIAVVNNSDTGSPASVYVQRCVEEGTTLHILGVAVSAANDLTWVQNAVNTWSSGSCLNTTYLDADLQQTSTVPNITFYEYSHPAPSLSNLTDPGSNSTGTTSSSSLASSTTITSSVSTSLGVSTTSTSASATSTGLDASATYTTPPAPTQTGIISTCNKWGTPATGEGCWDFTDRFGISLDDFYDWNPAVGDDCLNLWLNEAYCVGVSSSSKRDAYLNRRSECTTVQVKSGDSCAALAEECGISANDFTKYNSDDSLCSTLTPGQHVCCSEGDMPDFRPQENADGTCYAYTIVDGDNCANIGAQYSLTNDEIEGFNNGTTWGWSGCSNIPAKLSICLSDGYPPMPTADDNALCGPTVPGTEQPTNGTKLADLNPCPLNACCDMWGQCGITPLYCKNVTGPSGNPGTAPENEISCISNCGTDIVNNDIAPTEFINVGYYESWNWDRPCLNMRAMELQVSSYTHVHWAFATVGDDYTVSINDSYNQWEDFKALGVKRIVSLGGWGYSTDQSTYDKLREAMSPDNRVTFANNIIQFLNDEDIDGVDFDWEYPGAPDIPGIPAGLATDGENYFVFLGILRGLLGLDTTKTISFAAPASYWYLKQFPIKQMAGEADYVVYMTYDLHGQWDAGNEWSQDGCESGNCLRSHVNSTETQYTLAMITKAGVPTYQIAVGVSSYGRSFGMTEEGCTGPQCTFGGDDLTSTAEPGECTQTGGYISNAEILQIIDNNDTSLAIQSWYDEDTDSNYAVWNKTNWVAYMSDDVKEARMAKYKGMNFAGTVDWAADLASFGDYDGEPGGDDDDEDSDDEDAPVDPITLCESDPTVSVDGLTDDLINSWPQHCRAQYTLEALAMLLTEAHQNFTDLMNDGYDKKFKVYSKAVSDSALSQVHDFINDHGNDYFTCEVVEFEMCCSQCSGDKDTQCRYCLDGGCYKKRDEIDGTEDPEEWVHPHIQELEARGDIYPGWNKKLKTSWVNVTEPCPPDYSLRGYGPDNPYEQTVYWTLEGDKTNQFYADLLDATGIPQNKIGFGLYTDADMCGGSGHKTGDGADCWNTGYEFGHPYPNGYSADDVANPKSVAQQGLNNSANLPDQIQDVVNSLKGFAYPGDAYQVIDAVSLPIMMVAHGVESMSQVIQTADKIEEEERKALILAFIGAILFFVPIAGEVLGSVAELADIASIISIVGTIGNAALDVYTIVDDPDNAPLAIVDLIMAPLALADVAVIAKASNIKRGMTAEDLAKLGDRVGERMAKIDKVTGVCRK